jgi:hypothetical protein
MGYLLTIAFAITAMPLQAQESQSKTERAKAFLSKHKKKIAAGAAAVTAAALGTAIMLTDSEKEKIRKQYGFPANGTYVSPYGAYVEVTGYQLNVEDGNKYVLVKVNERPGKMLLDNWNQIGYKRTFFY